MICMHGFVMTNCDLLLEGNINSDILFHCVNLAYVCNNNNTFDFMNTYNV